MWGLGMHLVSQGDVLRCLWVHSLVALQWACRWEFEWPASSLPFRAHSAAAPAPSHSPTRPPARPPPAPAQSFTVMHKATSGDRRKLRAAFDDVTSKFTPVLHHFFLESFRDPGARAGGVGSRVGLLPPSPHCSPPPSALCGVSCFRPPCLSRLPFLEIFVLPQPAPRVWRAQGSWGVGGRCSRPTVQVLSAQTGRAV